MSKDVDQAIKVLADGIYRNLREDLDRLTRERDAAMRIADQWRAKAEPLAAFASDVSELMLEYQEAGGSPVAARTVGEFIAELFEKHGLAKKGS